ncbi:hypothetical protein OF83DRAFT_1165999 [Amylostereum chailletii]|nr:hypothetical protein OF83DRAFT_1165999 [Amylostereum chailletii]
MASTEDKRSLTTATTKVSTSRAVPDKYASFQRKLDALEKIHAEGKRSYQIDLDRLKGELSRAQKSTAEQEERAEKLRKHKDALDARVHDLKKAGVADQMEIKDLRVRLRLADNARAQLASKNGETGEMKKALHALEARRREELRERDQHIAELEKNISNERRKREAAELQLSDLKSKSNDHDLRSKESARKVEFDLATARAEAGDAHAALKVVREEAEEEKENLVSQLTVLQTALCRVVEQYSCLVTLSVSKAIHSKLKEEYVSLQLRMLRLERKLANSEGQVIELANLIRQAHGDKDFALARLRDAEDEVIFLRSLTVEYSHFYPVSSSIIDISGLADLQLDHLALEKEKAESDASTNILFARFYRASNRDMLSAYRSAVEELEDERTLLKNRVAELEVAKTARATLGADILSLRGELDAARRTQAETSSQLESSQASAAALQEQLTAVTSQQREASVSHKQALQTEKEAAQRLAATVQKHKMAEEGLRAEIEQLSNELVESDRFQGAYYSLVEHVEGLAARNALAEDEAERLSQFNAEILSHNNPAQRIMYLDRIRRELAETKQKGSALAQGELLLQELAMYKSVVPSGDLRPRTNITRVARIPLATQSFNGQSVESTSPSDYYSTGKYDPPVGLMTLDEIN